MVKLTFIKLNPFQPDKAIISKRLFKTFIINIIIVHKALKKNTTAV